MEETDAPAPHPVTTYDQLLSRLLPQAMARQEKAVRDVSGGPWSLDLSLGRGAVGPLETSIQLLGSVEESSGTWMAGWSVVEVNSLDPSLGVRSAHARVVGERDDVEELHSRVLPLVGTDQLGQDEPLDTFGLAMVVANLEEAVTVYRGPTPGGLLYFTLEDHRPDPLDALSVVSLLTRVAGMGLHAPSAGIEAMLELEGFSVSSTGSDVLATREGASVTVSFDDLGRVANISSGLGGARSFPS